MEPGACALADVLISNESQQLQRPGITDPSGLFRLGIALEVHFTKIA